jgi:hypothetical protein
MDRHKVLRSLIVMTLVAWARTAGASELWLFEHEDYRGRQFPAVASAPNLDNGNFSDRASSARIASGQWQLCSEPYFRGRCVTLGAGDYGSRDAIGLPAGVASARDLWDHDRGGAGGGGQREVVLYEAPNFGGDRFGVDDVVPNLDRTGFNDRARSMIVYSGTWELCEDADYRGACRTFGPGRYPDLGHLAGRLSSLRRVTAGGDRGRPAGGNWGGGNRAVLYEGPNLTGRMIVVDQYMANLDGTGFNDRAQSLRVERGYWIFCSDADFQGDCRTFGPGDYASLPAGLARRISSGRRISDDYPYRQNPSWEGR